MAINLKSTKQYASSGVKILVYGQAGAGKTTLIKTLPDPVIISAEGGLMSLQGTNIPYIEVKTLADIGEVFKWIKGSEEAAKFRSVALDSISEIAEVVLAGEKQSNKDARLAYGNMSDKMTSIIRAFRDLDRNVYFSAKLDKTKTDTDALLYAPSMPGQKLGQSLPYFFDEVLALRFTRDAEDNTARVLQCIGDACWLAKDRSGRLDETEPPDLGAVISKIAGAPAPDDAAGEEE